MLAQLYAGDGIGMLAPAGKRVAQDFAESVRWARIAAEAGDEDSQYVLGRSYAFGRGVTQDFVEAAKWFRLCADVSAEEEDEDIIERGKKCAVLLGESERQMTPSQNRGGSR